MVRGLSTAAEPVGRAPLIRHFALCGAALAVYAAREHLRVENSVLWVLGFAALLNLLTAMLSRWRLIGAVARFLAALFGLGAWTALTLVTGGVASPFVAGLSLEIALAAMTTVPSGIALVTTGGVAGLWFQQAILGLGGSLIPLTLHTCFLGVMGAATAYMARRWRRREEHLSRRELKLNARLGTLEKELDDVRFLGKIGENVARLAHSFKNAVHSLRGFARLMETRLNRSKSDRELLDGLQRAIDGLEDLARTTLGPPGPGQNGATGHDAGATARTVQEVVREMAASFPEVNWSVSLEPLPHVVRAPTAVIREVLAIVARNAAEAMRGHGEVMVAATPKEGHLQILVRDHGPGIPDQELERVFEPCYTTKSDGHGYGLFLARRLLEAQGGLLRMTSAVGGGTLCCIDLPLVHHRSAG